MKTCKINCCDTYYDEDDTSPYCFCAERKMSNTPLISFLYLIWPIKMHRDTGYMSLIEIFLWHRPNGTDLPCL